MASMIKNYIINEFITMETGSSMSSITLQETFAKYLPTDLTVVKSMPHYFKSIYVDYNADGTPVIIDINNASIIEMRGQYSKELPLLDVVVNTLLNQCMVDIIDDETDCLLHGLWLDYERYRNRTRKQHENKFYYYIQVIFRDETQHKLYEDFIQGIVDEEKKRTYQQDYVFLVTWFSITEYPHPFRTTRFDVSLLQCILILY